MKPTLLKLATGALVLFGLLLPLAGDASVFEFQSRLTLLGTAAGTPEIAAGTGVAEVNSYFGQIDSVRLLGGHVRGTTVVPITDPLVSNGGLVQVEISAELPLSASTLLDFDPFGGAFGSAVLTKGTLPLRGERRNCLLFSECNFGARQTLPFATAAGNAGYGVGGVITVGGTGTIRISLHGAPFALAPVTLTNPTQSGATATQYLTGFVHGPISNSFSGANTLSGVGGAIQLVSPVRTQATGGSGPGFGGHFVRLDLHFVPEPSLAFGLVASAGLLLALARSRR
jgi:hypothetical protein